jgi:menaquinone-dependent protoporphyrinogen oxidase
VNDRILVAYASQYGSTGEVAKAIGNVLCNPRSPVDVCLAKNVTDVSPYRAVVVGSAIQGGEWLPEALELIEVHREALSRVPVAYFLCCKRLRNDTPESRREAMGYMDGVRAHVPEINPVQVGLFAGKVDPSTMPLSVRLLTALSRSPTGDWRNWDAIRAWASSLRPVLQIPA